MCRAVPCLVVLGVSHRLHSINLRLFIRREKKHTHKIYSIESFSVRNDSMACHEIFSQPNRENNNNDDDHDTSKQFQWHDTFNSSELVSRLS